MYEVLLMKISGKKRLRIKNEQNQNPKVLNTLFVIEKMHCSFLGPQRKTFQVKLLSFICALNILKHEKYYKRKYDNLKKEAWNIVNTKNISKEALGQCYNVIRDTNKKMKWLSVIKSGDVPLDVIKDEYGNSDVFYLEKHLQTSVSEDVLDLSVNLKNDIDHFLNKCSK